MNSSEKIFHKNLSLLAGSDPKLAYRLPYYTPVKEVQRDAKKHLSEWLQSLSLGNASAIYFYGTGQGEHYEQLKEWLHEKKERVFIYVEDDLDHFYYFLHTEECLAFLKDPQAKLVYIPSLNEENSVLEAVQWSLLFVPFQVYCSEEYQKGKQAQFMELKHKLEYDSSIKNSFFQEYLDYGVSFYKNFYPNLFQLENSYLGNKLFGRFAGIPAIICGAGPSLEKQIPLLQKLTGKAIIFSGGSSLNALVAHRLIPHFGAGIDPNASQYKRLQENQVAPIPFFYRNRMEHNACKLIKGPRMYITGSGGYPTAAWFENKLGIEAEEEEIDEGHNVVNFCVEIARSLGCNPILFVGMDLAFTGMKNYADGVEVGGNRISEELKAQAVVKKDIYGEDIHTLWKWIAESQWIGQYAEDHPEVAFINATEGGIGMPGVTNMPLEKAVKEVLVKEYPVAEKIRAEIEKTALSQVNEKRIVEALQELYGSLQRCLDYLDLLKKDAEQIEENIKRTKEVPEMLQSGKAALLESELLEEAGYEAVLDVFVMVHNRMTMRNQTELKRIKSRVKKAMATLEIQKHRYSFLGNAAKVNMHIIDGILKQENR